MRAKSRGSTFSPHLPYEKLLVYFEVALLMNLNLLPFTVVIVYFLSLAVFDIAGVCTDSSDHSTAIINNMCGPLTLKILFHVYSATT